MRSVVARLLVTSFVLGLSAVGSGCIVHTHDRGRVRRSESRRSYYHCHQRGRSGRRVCHDVRH
jgi:hypothetical protein